MPFPVEQLFDGQRKIVSVKMDDPASKAFGLMTEHDYSQLPIVDQDDHPLGMVTYESILRGMRNFDVRIEELSVRDVKINVPTFNLEDDLFDLLDQLKLKNAVLIVDPAYCLTDIVTSYDTTEYFRERTENIMRVEDIETMIKEFIRLAFSDSKNELDVEALNSAIIHICKYKLNGAKTLSFEELTLSDYINLFLYHKTWNVLEPVFNKSNRFLRNLLDSVRKTRNDLAHFRNEITIEQQDKLIHCSAWLSDHLEEWENSREALLFSELINQESKTEQKSDSRLSSRYDLLADYLLEQPGSIDRLKLSFDEIEVIIGGALPASAYHHRTWWANDAIGHTQANSWLEVGWRTSYVNLSEKHVTFVRIKDREKAYINFFSELLKELSKNTGFPLRTVSPDGTNWMVVSILPSNGQGFASFTFSFSRNKQFRVELYIDTYEQKSSKKVFDILQKNKEKYEKELGEISWERINDKRASRIAIYHNGQITDSKETLADLRSWAAVMMVRFYEVFAADVKNAVDMVMNP
ncbi:MAG: hypothetical protein CL609_15120 [Anaerolineaceae bacterium]|nr:hypothetical protein [Anaerolineaceae bacterium]